VLLGEHHKIAEALAVAGEAVYSCNFVSIALALHHLRANAERAGVTLLERLTVAEDEPGYADWRNQIDLYRQHANARVKGLQKA
jgi:hypothetical protein